MPVPARLDKYIETDKQRHFSRDFMIGWENYETWEQATVGESDRKSTRLNSSHRSLSRMPSSA